MISLKKASKTLYQEQSQVLDGESTNTEITCKVKIPKLDCYADDLHDVMNSEPARSSKSAETNEYWISDLCLTLREREEIGKNKTPTSWHMEAVNMIARNQFPNIQGFQLTEKVPQNIAKEERWNIGAVMSPVEGPACQIHHTDRDHWVISFLVDDAIYFFDSWGNERNESSILTHSLRLQLAFIYGGKSSSLNIIIPNSHRRNNSIDCSPFAIAHLSEFCIKTKLCQM